MNFETKHFRITVNDRHNEIDHLKTFCLCNVHTQIYFNHDTNYRFSKFSRQKKSRLGTLPQMGDRPPI